ncbi:FAD-binding oxidoreductase [Erythrobacter sp. HKB08]|uniref:NAD(P)/FAD-dependent oxidoreductase n=1 Tax=Erythrobacter sp. HKB08 TaxID=2502843 RepID=UPI0010088A69|nr:FAD-dependent oxidoreductase [Erythrobacter sp. HKB08]
MRYDFAIVGAGIAGASLAAELCGDASVLLLEAEDFPGYHTTGRSAAFWEECYGGPELVPLTLASGPLLREWGFLSPRGALYVGRAQDRPKIDDFFERFGDTGATIERLDARGLAARVPGLREEWADAVWEPACADIDVAGLHGSYLARARRGGVALELRARVISAERVGGVWKLGTEDGRSFECETLVNAAGAWADELAAMVGAQPLGITPLQRTVAQIEVDPAAPADLPLVLDISGTFYFKPDNGRVWLSPHDETPTVPHDAAPEELAVAEAIDRFQRVVDWKVLRVERKWAGLRSFAPDRLPVYGRDPNVEGFAWFAGQGGYGIQTAPAAAILAADLLLERSKSQAVRDVDAATYLPDRLL